MTSGAFTATVSAITDAFGDPTRRGIYLFARDHGARASPPRRWPSEFGVHPNVARHHLDKLAAGGYLEVAVERAEGAGAGRPSKRYRSVADASIDVPVRSDDLVLSLLGGRLACCRATRPRRWPSRSARSTGGRWPPGSPGADVAAGQRCLRSAMQAVADALTAHGFAAHADQRNNQLRIINNHCPFGDVAIEHPVICAVDRGMVKGMLGASVRRHRCQHRGIAARGDTFCATAV